MQKIVYAEPASAPTAEGLPEIVGATQSSRMRSHLYSVPVSTELLPPVPEMRTRMLRAPGPCFASSLLALRSGDTGSVPTPRSGRPDLSTDTEGCGPMRPTRAKERKTRTDCNCTASKTSLLREARQERHFGSPRGFRRGTALERKTTKVVRHARRLIVLSPRMVSTRHSKTTGSEGRVDGYEFLYRTSLKSDVGTFHRTSARSSVPN